MASSASANRGSEHQYGAANGSPYGAERPADESDDTADADLSTLMDYPDDVDYYSLLGLSRSPAPTDSQIRSAYRTLTLSFHPDKHPSHLREVAESNFGKIQEAYETLIDPKKRAVYDLQGAAGVKREWSADGVMAPGNAAEQKQVGIKAMSPAEFRQWFLEQMKARERQVLDELVQPRGSLTVSLDASSMISASHYDDHVYLRYPTIQPYKYSIGYSFSTPLPKWRSIGTPLDEEDEGVKTPTNDQQLVSGGTEVIFDAGIDGKLSRPMRPIEVLYEDGTKETKEAIMPLIMVAKSLALSASIRHTITTVGLRKGALQTLAPPWLDGATVSFTGHIFPSPSLDAQFAKSVTLFPKTKPIGFTLRSNFWTFPISCPPLIGISMSRELGPRKHAYCSWSSGTLGWPDVLHDLLSPLVELGVPPEMMLMVPNQTSQFDVGFVCLPESVDVVEEDEPDFLGEKSSQSDAKETWHWRATASPGGGSLSVNYERNLFSGKVAEPARSEWNLDGYHPIATATEHQAVRLEIQATATIDGSLGWNISGTRQVGDFTRVGVGVGVAGGRGLVMSFSWRRLGQVITLPIILCPLDLVDADIAALAVVIPWVTYCGVEFGYIRPRERRRRRQAISRRQKELKKLTSKRKVESQQAIELMTEQVLRRQAREEAQGGLVITRAEYGYYPPSDRKVKGEHAERKVIDVTIPVAALVDHGQLIISRSTVKFQILGFYDPVPLLPKQLRIWYIFDGRPHVVEAGDSDSIMCPLRSHSVIE